MLSLSITALTISGVTFLWNLVKWIRERRAILHTKAKTLAIDSKEGASYEMWLLVRNLSYRPTSITEIKAKKENGGTITSGYWSEQKEVSLPLQVDAWETRRADITLNEHEWDNLDHILIKDMEETKFEIGPSTDGWRCPDVIEAGNKFLRFLYSFRRFISWNH